jgi:hypothetical protein
MQLYWLSGQVLHMTSEESRDSLISGPCLPGSNPYPSRRDRERCSGPERIAGLQFWVAVGNISWIQSVRNLMVLARVLKKTAFADLSPAHFERGRLHYGTR